MSNLHETLKTQINENVESLTTCLDESKTKSKRIELTVWSPVNTEVYLNDKNKLVMKIDRNTGFDYKINTIFVSKSFDLIFVGKEFEKKILFDLDSIDDVLEFKVRSILSQREMLDSYDRGEAIEQLKHKPSAYAFEQLSETGTNEDVDLLIAILKEMVNGRVSYNTNYLIACCAKTLGVLSIKYNRLHDISFILDIYKNYEAKPSYGYMFSEIIKHLS